MSACLEKAPPFRDLAHTVKEVLVLFTGGSLGREIIRCFEAFDDLLIPCVELCAKIDGMAITICIGISNHSTPEGILSLWVRLTSCWWVFCPFSFIWPDSPMVPVI